MATSDRKDLLRLLTCGSVDDGKSTLIGRLLHDSKEIYEDHLRSLERDSKKVGSAGGAIDFSLPLDGLKAGASGSRSTSHTATSTPRRNSSSPTAGHVQVHPQHDHRHRRPRTSRSC
jgi:translation elongation factor EF-1alpha